MAVQLAAEVPEAQRAGTGAAPAPSPSSTTLWVHSKPPRPRSGPAAGGAALGLSACPVREGLARCDRSGGYDNVVVAACLQ